MQGCTPNEQRWLSQGEVQEAITYFQFVTQRRSSSSQGAAKQQQQSSGQADQIPRELLDRLAQRPALSSHGYRRRSQETPSSLDSAALPQMTHRGVRRHSTEPLGANSSVNSSMNSDIHSASKGTDSVVAGKSHGAVLSARSSACTGGGSSSWGGGCSALSPQTSYQTGQSHLSCGGGASASQSQPFARMPESGGAVSSGSGEVCVSRSGVLPERDSFAEIILGPNSQGSQLSGRGSQDGRSRKTSQELLLEGVRTGWGPQLPYPLQPTAQQAPFQQQGPPPNGGCNVSVHTQGPATEGQAAVGAPLRSWVSDPSRCSGSSKKQNGGAGDGAIKAATTSTAAATTAGRAVSEQQRSPERGQVRRGGEKSLLDSVAALFGIGSGGPKARTDSPNKIRGSMLGFLAPLRPIMMPHTQHSKAATSQGGSRSCDSNTSGPDAVDVDAASGGRASTKRHQAFGDSPQGLDKLQQTVECGSQGQEIQQHTPLHQQHQQQQQQQEQQQQQQQQVTCHQRAGKEMQEDQQQQQQSREIASILMPEERQSNWRSPQASAAGMDSVARDSSLPGKNVGQLRRSASTLAPQPPPASSFPHRPRRSFVMEGKVRRSTAEYAQLTSDGRHTTVAGGATAAGGATQHTSAVRGVRQQEVQQPLARRASTGPMSSFVDMAMPSGLRTQALQQLEQRKMKPARSS
ncbi:hypothetical protein DUNSADRAFT_16899 [Dunaliella salina]|uniref:Uncharacterized protein n=1 Tax=Dunaliella salina TaxID=3046 RepID=A0ABQ7H978_DUNSA|nr:hypothetical protein DUNSADRAFT_16899 [Dunaliella salina]|eukprot:KAF5843400.1 hypothetical protein DUNSADRAFT_16899 [Dunaliella salina]